MMSIVELENAEFFGESSHDAKGKFSGVQHESLTEY
jgi:hypothetical protein